MPFKNRDGGGRWIRHNACYRDDQQDANISITRAQGLVPISTVPVEYRTGSVRARELKNRHDISRVSIF